MNPEMSFVWRGQQNANWGLHSSLYRHLLDHNGIACYPPGKGNPTHQTFPSEDAMLAAELAMLDEASAWRMSETPALELFARLQHHGGPTRLIDVTRNPLIAAWFAVESGHDEADARLFALATGPAANVDAEQLIAEVLASSRYPFWTYESPRERARADWGTGARRRIWVPPAYDARIAAQNAAFLLEGVPLLTADTLRLFSTGTKGQHWKAADVAAAMSIHARPSDPHKRPRATKTNLAPLFTFRITAAAKDEIRQMLDRTYGYTTALLYPDIQCMSTRVRRHTDWLERAGALEG